MEAGSNMPSRWLRTSRPGPRNSTTEPKTRLQSARSSGFNFDCWLVNIALLGIAYKRMEVSNNKVITLHIQNENPSIPECSRRRLKQAGLPAHYSPHSFRATGITNFLEN